jgi:hypothetical protein
MIYIVKLQHFASLLSIVTAQQFDGHFVESNEMCKYYFIEPNVNALRTFYRLTAGYFTFITFGFSMYFLRSCDRTFFKKERKKKCIPCLILGDILGVF